MNRKLAWLFALLIIMAGVYAVSRGGAPTAPAETPKVETVVLAPEDALPGIAEKDEYILLRVVSPELLQAGISSLTEIFTDLAEDEEFPERAELSRRGLTKALVDLRKLDSMSGVLTIAEELAALIVSGDRKGLYVSFRPSPAYFEAFIASPDLSGYRLSPWASGQSAEGAWMLQYAPAGEPGPETLYLLRQTASAGGLVLLSDSEVGIDTMLDGSTNGSARFSVVRCTDGPNYLQAKLPFDLPRHGALPGDTIDFVEMGWTEQPGHSRIEVYTNYYESSTALISNVTTESSWLPLIGGGEVGFLVTVDIPFFCHSLFPDEQNPVVYLLREFEALLPRQQFDDVRATMEQGKISCVVVVDRETQQPLTAYLLLESGAKEALGRLFLLGSFLVNKPFDLLNWQSAYATEVEGIGVVLAHNDNILLLGAADRADHFQGTATLPAVADDPGSAKNLVNVLMTSSLLRAGNGSLGQLLARQFAERGIPTSVIDNLHLENVDAMHMRMREPGRMVFDVYRQTTAH